MEYIGLKILSRITEPTTGTVDIYGRVASLLEACPEPGEGWAQGFILIPHCLRNDITDGT